MRLHHLHLPRSGVEDKINNFQPIILPTGIKSGPNNNSSSYYNSSSSDYNYISSNNSKGSFLPRFNNG